MLGDGSIGIYNCKAGNKVKKQYQLKVTLDSRNKWYIQHVSRLMSRVLKVKPVVYYRRGENTADVRTFRRDALLYAVNGLGLKISPKVNRMRIPDSYLNGELDLPVLKGMFDTDGSVTVFKNNRIIYPRLEIKICKSPAQNQIIQVLDKYNFNYRIQALDKGSIRIRLSGRKELARWFDLIGSSNCTHIEKSELFLT